VQDGVALANTHDSFYFGTIVQKAALGRHLNNSLIPDPYHNGMITALPYWLIKVFPSLSIEQLLLWLPVYVSGLVCIPIVLIGRLYGCTVFGFGAACLAVITHSYYNRTLAGYYDTDIFAITSPAFSVFFLLAASRKRSIGFLVVGAISLLSGRFFYGSIQPITCSIAIGFLGYHTTLFFLSYFAQKLKIKNLRLSGSEGFSFWTASLFLASWVLYAEGWSDGKVIDENFSRFIFGILFPFIFYLACKKFLTDSNQSEGRSDEISKERIRNGVLWINFTLILCLLVGVAPMLNFGPFSNTWSKLFGGLQTYSVVGKAGTTFGETESLKFLDVKTTIREASQIPFEVVRNRILADTPTCSCPRCMPEGLAKAAFVVPASLLGLVGLFLLMLRYWEFCITLPFVGIAYNCFQGNVGLRFTVHVGNYAAIGLVFLLLVLLWGGTRYFLKKRESHPTLDSKMRWANWLAVLLLVGWFAQPNLQHAANYHSHVVYPVKTMEVLQKLNEASNPDDYVVTWWDYGSGCWFHGDTRTFTSPAHQTKDNFLSSEILRSTSLQKAVNLSLLKTETFKKISQAEIKGEIPPYPTAVETIFKDGQLNQPLYQTILSDAEDPNFKLPPKTQDTFIFLPYEILRIFPTILSFSSRNLYFSGNEGSNSASINEPPMMILRDGHRQGSSYVFENGYRIDRRGYLVVNADSRGAISYGQAFQVDESGGPAKVISTLEADGLTIPLRNDPANGRRILFLPKRGDLVIMSADTFRSSFARRFLLNKFDANAYDHPIFGESANPRKQPFFTQADWVTSQGPKLNLNMRGGYRIEADLATLTAKIPNSNGPIPFSFHRKMHNEATGKLTDIPSQENPDARFHLIQTNIPSFLGDREYIVPKGGKTISEIAKIFSIPVRALASYERKSKSNFLDEGESIQIPGMGYRLGQAWFFMDQEAFDSLLVRGYFMENLDPSMFEKVYCTTWGKVYKIIAK
jgi:undecaprenyl-diphosphooligosaccharide--protein glycosyltransferase